MGCKWVGVRQQTRRDYTIFMNECGCSVSCIQLGTYEEYRACALDWGNSTATDDVECDVEQSACL